MGFFDNLEKSKGGYIFISHSHDDIERVRIIRNELEKFGFEPLCFYLKCLDDDSEIEDLIKREIDAREWFVFVNSENSRKSRWVTLEREYITKTNSKKIITVDIDDDKSINDTVQKITHNLRMFISCSSRDMELAKRIKNKLEEKDYLVFLASENLPVDSNYSDVIADEIAKASQEGGVVALITPSYFKSLWTRREIEFAVRNRGNIIPVFVGDVEYDNRLRFCLSSIQGYYLSEDPTDEQIKEMIDKIGRTITK